jgi:hypothetical protein
MEVIIWDNGSTDGTQKEVGRIFVEMEKEGWKVLNESDSDHNIFIPGILINAV